MDESDRRFEDYSFFPIKNPRLEEYYQKQKNMFWTPQEIDYSEDRQQWDSLDDDTKKFLEFILFFFSQADGIVNENLIENFKRETSVYKEASFFYAMQEAIEVIHNETYSLLIETFIRDEEKKAKAFNAISHFPSIRALAEWMFSWMNKDIPLSERVIAFSCVEGVFFTSAFAAVYWIKKRNILQGLCKANEFIARDEALHTEFAVSLYHTLVKDSPEAELSRERVFEILGSAAQVSETFIRDALHVDLVGLSGDDMVNYMKCTVNSLSTSLGYGNIFDVENPFPWMSVIALPNKSNFFETKVSEYGRQATSDYTFDLDIEF